MRKLWADSQLIILPYMSEPILPPIQASLEVPTATPVPKETASLQSIKSAFTVNVFGKG